MGYQSWSVKMDRDGATFEKSTDEHLQWAFGQATTDLANSYATGMPVIRRAAKRVREEIMREAERRGYSFPDTWRWSR